MSRLDDLVRNFAINCYKDINVKKDKIFKQDIKSLFLDLIGDDYTTTTYGNAKEFIDIVNKEKAKLRKKIEEL